MNLKLNQKNEKKIELYWCLKKKEQCRKRPSMCPYCELSLDFDKLNEHVEYCGTRTEKCDKCLRYVQTKDRTRHETSNCEYPTIVKTVSKKSAKELPVKSNSLSNNSRSMNDIYGQNGHKTNLYQFDLNSSNKKNGFWHFCVWKKLFFHWVFFK